MNKNNTSSSPLFISIAILFSAVIIGGAIYTGALDISNSIKEIPKTVMNDAQKKELQPSALEDNIKNNEELLDTIDMKKITVDENLVLGNKNAPVTIVEFSDFRCGFCKKYHEEISPSLTKEYIDTGKVKFVFKNYAFMGGDSEKLAQGLWCANDQGKYWQYHDYVFSNDIKKIDESMDALTIALGLNKTTFKNCLDKGTYKDKVLQELEEGKALGVTGTPATFINGKSIPGAQPYSVFKEEIEKELR